MAKEKLGLKSTLGLSPKVQLKKSEVDVEATEAATKKIHEQVAKQSNVKIRLSTDISEELYDKFQHKVFEEKKKRRNSKFSGQQLVRELIEEYLSK